LENKKSFIITANSEAFMLAEKNSDFKSILLKESSVIIPDGIGIVKAARSLGIDIKDRITGIDLVRFLFECADKFKKSIFLYGAKPEVMDLLTKKLSDEYPGITISGAYNGYDYSDDNIADKVLLSKPDIILAALGMPRQEIFLNKCAGKLDKGIFVGVGGSFDVISGKKKRAPNFFIKLNLEWLYRIIKEPKRIKRFFSNNLRFMFLYKK
jgi:N-acetylglucosaminyldiphosphoundecaprenol N-acetyl-beta-D-mannosaminyltransferase